MSESLGQLMNKDKLLHMEQLFQFAGSKQISNNMAAQIDNSNDITYSMLCEMNDKAKKLCNLMKQGIVEFVFKKKSTGKTRKARGTLKRDLIPTKFQRKRGRPKKRPEDLVIYYDVEKKDIRSFKDYLLQKDGKLISKQLPNVTTSSEKTSKQIITTKQKQSNKQEEK